MLGIQQPRTLLLTFLVAISILAKQSDSTESSGSTSFDSLIASQCVSRCLSLYPWKLLNNSHTASSGASASHNDRKHRSNLFRHRRAFGSSYSLNLNNNNSSSSSSSSGILSADSNQHSKHPPHNVKWHKVMEMCSKNTNCLQCSLPCDIPTNLLPSCKYLCKNQNPLCIESCSLLNKLNEEKYGSCPHLEQSNSNECSNSSLKIASQLRALQYNNEDSYPKESALNECNKDSDCVDMRKCCNLNPKCPEQGKVCLKPQIVNQNLPSVPFNLKIVERKKGKTIILSWDCSYNKNKPTLFVVEGRWSLKQPQVETFPPAPASATTDPDSYMTKWGYLAQSANNNWIILRNINRGRWYKFRVAAVSKSGTHGYSKPTELFILSSAPKPPSEPQNLTILQMSPSAAQFEGSYINVDVGWLPSRRSDMPILNYRLTWKRKLQTESSQKSISKSSSSNNNTNDYTDTEDDSSYNLSADLNKADYGTELIDAQGLNKFTIKNLLRHSVYSIELVAISNYDKELLISTPQRVRLDTSNINLAQNQQPAAFLLSDYAAAATNVDQQSQIQKESNNIKNNNQDLEDDDEDDEEEDDDLEPAHHHSFQSHSSERNQRLIVDQSQSVQNEQSNDLNEIKRPTIRNLTIQSPFFQNGLVKAKLSWQIEETNAKQQKQQEESSINFISDQPMFTITWFAIKCTGAKSSQMPQKQLPTPITATTINTNFEIYELKYNCDYVVNVRLANNNKQPIEKTQPNLSSSLNRPVPPQIASTQFKVPACTQIKLVGRISPICYPAASQAATNDLISETSGSQDRLEIMTPTKKSILFSSITSTLATTVTTTPEQLRLLNPLPAVSNIHYKIVGKKNSKLYSVEFFWSLPKYFNKNTFNGFQISIVPKAIPGFTMFQQQQNENEEGTNFIGSVGAIVEKEKQSFTARQLSSSIKYIFQIQLIGLDNQSYGPASNLEFLITESEFVNSHNFKFLKSNEQPPPPPKKSLNSLHQSNNNNIQLNDYDLNSYDLNDANLPFYLTSSSKSNEVTSSSSLSSSNLILNNSNSLSHFKSFHMILGVSFILTFYLI